MGAEKRGLAIDRLCSQGFGGPLRSPSGSKGEPFTGDQGAEPELMEIIIVSKSVYIGFWPLPPHPRMEIFFSMDLHWSQEWPELTSQGVNSAHGLKIWRPVKQYRTCPGKKTFWRLFSRGQKNFLKSLLLQKQIMLKALLQWKNFRGPPPGIKMQLDVEVSPPVFVEAQLKLECTSTVPGVYMKCRLNVGCIGFAVHMTYTIR